MDDEALWAAFSARTLTHEEWTHRAHLRMAYLYLARFADIDEAHLRMRIGIVRLNTAHGIEESPKRGYHETMTRAWLELVRHARASDPAEDSQSFLERHPHLLHRDAPLRHYTREVLLSLKARSVFVPPNVAPF
jgi:hypothetical protein